MRCAARASNGPNRLGLCAIQGFAPPRNIYEALVSKLDFDCDGKDGKDEKTEQDSVRVVNFSQQVSFPCVFLVFSLCFPCVALCFPCVLLLFPCVSLCFPVFPCVSSCVSSCFHCLPRCLTRRAAV